jgi:hypothetical protein
MSLLKALWSGHSHSIVSGASKHLKSQDFLSGYAPLTVKTTAKYFRLRAIDGERSRKHRTFRVSRSTGWWPFCCGAAAGATSERRRSSADDHVNS